MLQNDAGLRQRLDESGKLRLCKISAAASAADGQAESLSRPPERQRVLARRAHARTQAHTARAPIHQSLECLRGVRLEWIDKHH